jgi:soluble lytic murein transglycosylase-like protein
VTEFVKRNERAHRAAALAQIGRFQECGEELRAGLALAGTDQERARWTELAQALGVPATARGPGLPARIVAPIAYPAPPLEPKAGFTLDKAMVYAIVRQESAFNPLAVSPKGAVGLMQLMPGSAARAAGDDKLRTDTAPLLDPATNLRVGQDYFTWLMQNGTGYDLIKTVAAYNGGPGLVAKTSQMLGRDADDLLLMECLPAAETRAYVQRVMAGYWSYRRQFGEDTRTLTALAAGAREVDARLDLPQPGGGGADQGPKSLLVGMR